MAYGYPDGTFRPEEPVTREAMAAFSVRLVEYQTGSALPEAEYNHVNDTFTNEVFRQEINKAIENDIVRPYENKAFYPGHDASRLEAAETLYLISRYLGGDILDTYEGLLLHVSQAQADFESGTVSLTVDSKFRDLATLDQIIERTKAENQNPAKMLVANRESGTTDDTKFPWDYNAGSGSLPKKPRVHKHDGDLPKGTPNVPEEEDWFVFVNGANSDAHSRWTVVPVVLAGKGSVSRSEIRAFDAAGNLKAIPFHVGVYSQYVTAYSMPANPFLPEALKESLDDPLAGYHSSAIILWGQDQQRAGYWPGLETEGNDPTGILIDEGTWQFQFAEGEHVAYVAIYAEEDAYFQGRFHHGVQ